MRTVSGTYKEMLGGLAHIFNRRPDGYLDPGMTGAVASILFMFRNSSVIVIYGFISYRIHDYFAKFEQRLLKWA